MLRIIVIALLFLSSCERGNKQNRRSLRVKQSQTVERNYTAWKENYFPFIDELVGKSGMVRLQDKMLAKNEKEIRIWSGFGEYLPYLRCVVIRRDSNFNFSGLYIEKFDGKKQQINAVSGGWLGLMAKLENQRIYDLPDCSRFKNPIIYLGDRVYVVEVNIGGKYRAYHYDTASIEVQPAGKNMAKIAEIVRDSFGIGMTF